MIITDTCINRPVFSTVISLLIILVGIISYQNLTLREYPNIDEPVVTVETKYPGASAEIIESQISKPLEDSLAGIEGIDVLSSISRAEFSQITVRFRLTRDPDNAASDVRDRVGRVRDVLPDEIDEPVISKVEADAQPIMYIAFSSDRHNPMEITDYADRYIKDQLQNLEGVSKVRVFGEREMSMRIWVDKNRMAAYKVTTQDVEDAIRSQNVEIPSGRIESEQREFTVLSETDLKTPEEFNNIIIKRQGNNFVRLHQIGEAEIGVKTTRSVVRFKGNQAVALGVIKQSTANPLDVSKAVNKILPKITSTMPKGMKLDIAYDSSKFIDRSIDAVYFTIFKAIVLVVLVIFLFLRNAKATFIPLVTIPVSLIGAFMAMYAFDFSINTLSLLAMVLAVGLVVDDAIVMLENIYRHIENGMKPLEAAFKGSKEVAFAVIAMTITLAAVYAPVAFMTGRTGKLFTEFSVTLAGAVIISGIVALTLTPMMCSKLLKHEKRHGKFYYFIEDFLNALTIRYEGSLHYALHNKAKIVLIGLLIASISGILFFVLKSELAPTEDRGTIVSIAVAPEGATVDYTAKWMTQMEGVFKSVPEVERYFVISGFPVVSQGLAFLGLYDWEDRGRKQQVIVNEITPQLFAGIPGVLSFAINPPSLGGRVTGKDLEFIVQTTGSYEELEQIVGRIMAKTYAFPGFIGSETDLKLNKPQLSFSIDRDKAASIGVRIDEVGRTLETMLGGREVTRFKNKGEQYDVIVKLTDEDRATPSDLTGIFVRGNNDKMVQISNIASIEETVAPKELNHFNQLRSAKISANLTPGYSLSDAVNFIEKTAAEVLPVSASYDYDGNAREFKESSHDLYITFVLALGFIFLVLSAQFESFSKPIIILLTVPLSITGALMALYFTGGTLNVYSQIGLITLIGLISKHGILIVDFANHQREQGSNVLEAIKESAMLRLRPILMTTGATILGAIPLAIASGAGAESRQQIGWVIIGGMFIGTIFTLFVIPVVYALFVKDEAVEESEDVVLENP